MVCDVIGHEYKNTKAQSQEGFTRLMFLNCESLCPGVLVFFSLSLLELIEDVAKPPEKADIMNAQKMRALL